MDVPAKQTGKPEYTTPRWVQVWFLGRSRDRWKRKHHELKTKAKRLQNQVNDVTKSREKWREESRQLRQRLRKLEAENAALREQAAALKKGGPGS
jgi:SMC interacting uncharacterized protein involved in chromosome segregation